MRDYPFGGSTCQVVVNYTNTIAGVDGYTDDILHTFEFTRVPFLGLSDAAKHRLCNGGELEEGDLAPGTYVMLYGVPRYSPGEGSAPTTGFRPCCCHCAPRLYVGPLSYEDEALEIGTRTYPDESTAPIYASEVTFGLFAKYCRRGIALKNLAGPTGPEELDATLTNVVTGSAGPPPVNQEVTVTWPLYDQMTASVNVDWLSPDDIPWRFTFAVARVAGSYFLSPTLPVIGLQPGATPEQEAAFDAANKSALFRLSGLPNGGRLGFIGAYGGQSISGLDMDGEATGEGYTYAATLTPTIGPDISTWNIDGGTFLLIGKAIEVDPCPDSWDAVETYDIYTGEDVTGEATLEVDFVA